ncbi:MAG: hypothetical protein KDA96_28755, partial [Planctomycetaceae bacterium]|nr:hypothetical protein [Planctomycetaceae bacterium]
ASGTAAGGIWHLALVGWLSMRELPVESVTWISINGSAPSLQELMAGGVDVVCCSVPEAQALLDGGEIRCLGVMSDDRCAAAPDVLTFAEQGIHWSMGGWRGLMYPPNVPAERVERMEKAALKVAGSDEFQRFMAAAGFHTVVTDGRRFAQFLSEADAEFGAILSRPGMQQQQRSPISRYFVPGLLGIAATLVAVSGWL